MLSVSSVSVDPSGTRIAVGADASTSLDVDEVVLVLSIADGKEVLHRNLPRYTRPQVAFLGDGLLAISAKGKVDVVRVPASLQPLEPVPPTGPTTRGKPTDVDGQILGGIEAMGTML